MNNFLNVEFDLNISEEFAPPDIRITFYMSSMLTEEQEKEIESLITSWYNIGFWNGFKNDEYEGGFHCLNDVIFDDEQCLYIAADLGNTPLETSLQGLFNSIESMLDYFGVKIEKVDIE